MRPDTGDGELPRRVPDGDSSPMKGARSQRSMDAAAVEMA